MLDKQKGRNKLLSHEVCVIMND